MSELKPCPFCGSKLNPEYTISYDYIKKCYVLYHECTFLRCHIAIYGATQEECITAWNRRAQPANEPLTLDELRGMDGDKILIHYIGQCEGFYVDVIAPYYGQDEQYIGKDNGKLAAVYLPLSGYGVGWLAYRRKPEGSDTP